MYRNSKLRTVANFEFVMKNSSERLKTERERKIMYDEFGNLKILGVLSYYSKKYGKQVALLFSGLIAFYIYEKIIIKLSIEENEKMKRHDRESEQRMMQTGKVKDARYLVKPNRQIDDPDFLNTPSFGGKGVWKSKLETEESFRDEELHAEFKRFRG